MTVACVVSLTVLDCNSQASVVLMEVGYGHMRVCVQ